MPIHSKKELHSRRTFVIFCSSQNRPNKIQHTQKNTFLIQWKKGAVPREMPSFPSLSDPASIEINWVIKYLSGSVLCKLNYKLLLNLASWKQTSFAAAMARRQQYKPISVSGWFWQRYIRKSPAAFWGLSRTLWYLLWREANRWPFFDDEKHYHSTASALCRVLSAYNRMRQPFRSALLSCVLSCVL